MQWFSSLEISLLKTETIWQNQIHLLGLILFSDACCLLWKAIINTKCKSQVLWSNHRVIIVLLTA